MGTDNAINLLLKFYKGTLTAPDIDNAILELGGIPTDISNVRTCVTCEHYFHGLTINFSSYCGIRHPPDYCERNVKYIPKFDVVHGISYNNTKGESLYCGNERDTGLCGINGNFWTPIVTKKLMW